MEKYQPEAHTRNYVKRDAAQARAYSPAVVTQGGKVVWLAGQTVVEDSTGTSLVVEGSSSLAAFAASSSASPGMRRCCARITAGDLMVPVEVSCNDTGSLLHAICSSTFDCSGFRQLPGRYFAVADVAAADWMVHAEDPRALAAVLDIIKTPFRETVAKAVLRNSKISLTRPLESPSC